MMIYVCIPAFRFVLFYFLMTCFHHSEIDVKCFLCKFQEYNPHTMSEDEVKLLTIKHLQRNDTGAYLCRVLNEYGYNDLVHYLHVLPGNDFVFVRNKIFRFFLKILNDLQYYQ
jgi:hypothetical protein